MIFCYRMSNHPRPQGAESPCPKLHEIQDMNEEAERAALEASIAKAEAEMAEKKQALEALKARRKS